MSERPDDVEPDEPQEPAVEEAPVEEAAAQKAAEPQEQTRSPWRRVYLMARPRPTRANLFALLLAALLGFAIATQVSETQEQGLEDLRQDELVRILDDVSQNGERLDTEIAELESSRDQLRSEGGSVEAVRSAQERLDTLGILAGTVPATGPGVTVTLDGDGDAISATVLLDAMQELRDAGAEAMQVDDVRLVAGSYFTDADGSIQADGQTLTRPYTFTVIGDAQTLSSAMEIPGGITESVRGRGGQVTVTEQDEVSVDALHRVSSPRYARPVPEPSASR